MSSSAPKLRGQPDLSHLLKPTAQTPGAVSLGSAGAKRLAKLGVAALARREHTRFELHQKLRQRLQDAETLDELDEALRYLQAKGYLDEQRAAASLIRLYGARWGHARLAQLFQTRGLNPQDWSHLFPPATSELPTAYEVWQKKFGVAPADSREWARQARFLAARGFSGGVVARILQLAKTGASPFCSS